MTKNLCYRYSFIFFSALNLQVTFIFLLLFMSLYIHHLQQIAPRSKDWLHLHIGFFFFEWWLHLHIIKKPFSWNYYLVPVYVHQTFKFLLDLFWELIISFVNGRKKKKKSTGRWIKIKYLVQRVYGTNARRWIICCSHAVQSNSRSSPLTCPKKAPLNLIISLYHLLQRMLPKALSDFPSPMKLHSLNLLH